ncbi:MAG: geranylgeranyl reductase family protein [Candidatus Thorarchaeota archaeon]
MSYDVIIIGGGPSGLIAAQRIARDGHQVLILEEHRDIGYPDHCAGLISSSGLSRLGLKTPKEVIQNNITGARIFSPSNHTLTIERGKREALVVNRHEFDKWLAREAQSSGAEIRTECPVRDVFYERGEYIVHCDSHGRSVTERSRVVINAEGSRGHIAKRLGLSRVPRSHKYPAYQYEVSGVDIPVDYVEMFYGRQISKGFFAWLIPLGGGRARVGIASKDHAKLRLERCMRKHEVMADRLGGMQIERGFGGVVLVGLPMTRTAHKGAVSLGDAAGIVKSTTGGGIVVGGAMAQIAGAYISKVLLTENGTVELNKFDHKWKSVLYRELQAMFIAQKMLTSLSDKGIDTVVEGANRYGLLEIVRREGDMDMQRKVISRLLQNPKMLLLGLRTIRYLYPF